MITVYLPSIILHQKNNSKQLWEFSRHLFGNTKIFHSVHLDVPLNNLLCSAPFNSRHRELVVELACSMFELRCNRLTQILSVRSLAAKWILTFHVKVGKTVLLQTVNENTPRFCCKESHPLSRNRREKRQYLEQKSG